MPRRQDIELAQRGLEKLEKIIKSKSYDVVIADELNVALKVGLIKLRQVLELLRSAHKKTELIITGRYANPEVLKIADLVSEVRQIKHYYRKGIKSRIGIEC